MLGIDHGEKRIGVAISDSTGTIARPLTILKHASRIADARQVLDLAAEHQVNVIVIGESTDEEGVPNLAGRRAGRFAQVLKTMTAMKVVLWDESLSTREAREWRIASGASRKKRATRIDAVAAAAILQSYLDAQRLPQVGREAWT
ncbi:MAG: Holliday junction resolvase RuvX [Chloroflexota bacterium]